MYRGKQQPEANVYKAIIVELLKPKLGSKTVSGVMEIIEGNFVGRKAVFVNSSVVLFGRNLKDANLMDIFHISDQYNVTILEPARSEAQIGRAWIGSTTPIQQRDLERNPEFQSWLQRHEMENFAKFVAVVEGKTIFSPYFPIIPLEKRVKYPAVVNSIYPPTKELPNHFGLLKITNGPLANQIVPFEPDDLFIFMYSLGRCEDLSQILFSGEKLQCEIRQPTLTEETHWKKVLEVCCDNDGRPLKIVPHHVVYLAYVGLRPQRQMVPLKFNFTADELSRNTNLKMWLDKRQISCSTFSEIVAGGKNSNSLQGKFQGRLGGGPNVTQELPKTNPNQQNKNKNPPENAKRKSVCRFFVKGSCSRNNCEFLHPEGVTTKPMVEAQGGYQAPFRPIQNKKPGLLETPKMSQHQVVRNVDPVQISQFMDAAAGIHPAKDPIKIKGLDVIMNKSEVLTRRIMSCISPEDPKVDSVIESHDELELAMFMSKTLVASIMSFTKREKAGKVPQPQTVIDPRPQMVNERVEYETRPSLAPVNLPRPHSPTGYAEQFPKRPEYDPRPQVLQDSRPDPRYDIRPIPSQNLPKVSDPYRRSPSPRLSRELEIEMNRQRAYQESQESLYKPVRQEASRYDQPEYERSAQQQQQLPHQQHRNLSPEMVRYAQSYPEPRKSYELVQQRSRDYPEAVPRSRSPPSQGHDLARGGYPTQARPLSPVRSRLDETAGVRYERSPERYVVTRQSAEPVHQDLRASLSKNFPNPVAVKRGMVGTVDSYEGTSKMSRYEPVRPSQGYY